LLIKYPVPATLDYDGECQLNSKRSDYLNWVKVLKILLLCAVFSATSAQAENYPDLNDDSEFSLMKTLSDRGWHNLQDERWNLYSQGTYIASFKQAFPAAYTAGNACLKLAI